MFVDLDYTKKIPQPKLKLAKPNKEIISSLHEIFPTINYKINNINEMTMNIPIFVEEDNNFVSADQEESTDLKNKYPKLIKNPHIEQIQNGLRHLIYIEFNNTKEWFIIISTNDIIQENKDYISVQCMSLGYELKDKKLKNYNTPSSTLKQVLLGNDQDDSKGILYNTDWNVGYIDKKYDKIYREFNFSGSVLNAIFELTNTFKSIVDFDTENRKINFYYRDNYGKNTGIVFNYNKYLKTINRERNADSDNMCTRLKCFGKDNLSIENINPTGQSYLDDFTYFMYPFEINKDGDIVKHSYYMSDELCIALIKFKIKIIQNRGKFTELYDNKNTYDKLIIYKKQELSNLKNQLNIFSDKLAVARNSGNSIQPILDIKKEIESDIQNKNKEIDKLNQQLENINNKIDIIRKDLAEKNNFTNTQLQELYKYVIEDNWEDGKYIDEKDLYLDGLKKLSIKSKPKTTINIDHIKFIECLEEQNMWNKLKLGDKITVRYPLLNIDEDFRYGMDSYTPLDDEGGVI